MDSVSTPLVSIAVITYNSSKYVLETLESAKAQTYQNIELIISDDCSTDNTVQICKDWVEQNKQRFARVQIVESVKNTGVSANCNRAEDACQGEWVKLIAGDDILLSNCIEDYVAFVKNNPSAWNVFGRMNVFGENLNDAEKKGFNDWMDGAEDFSLLDVRKQYESLLCSNSLPAPTYFYKKNQNLREKGFDERIPLIEDYPRWINLTRRGNRLYFIKKVMVNYRVHDKSISKNMYSRLYLYSLSKIYIYYLFSNHVKKSPRIAVYKYIKLKHFVSNHLIWFFVEYLFYSIEFFYCLFFNKKKIVRKSLEECVLEKR